MTVIIRITACEEFIKDRILRGGAQTIIKVKKHKFNKMQL